ncbi:chemotaxis protein CheX [Myxococcota bacterium]|nr:chemotaxis protein CheX [Myxococcota bacterium]
MFTPDAAVLTRVASSVLADGAFMLTEPAETPLAAEDALVFAVPFRASVSGCVLFEAPIDLGFEMMSNLDDDTSDLQLGALDAMREMTNILAGALMPELFGDEVVELGVPSGPGEPVPPGSSMRTDLVTDEGHHLAVLVTWGAAS